MRTILLLITSIALAGSLSSCNNATITDAEIATQYNLLKDENIALYDSIANLNLMLSSTAVYSEAQTPTNEQVNDVKAITMALLTTPQIIPDSAVLGGKMAFDNIKVLNDKWVYASFNDGHINNEAIFSYTKNRNQTYTFQTLLKLN